MPRGLCGGEAVGDLGREVDHARSRERFLAQQVAQGPALEQSVTNYVTPSSWPMSWTERMFGWSSAAAAWAC